MTYLEYSEEQQEWLVEKIRSYLPKYETEPLYIWRNGLELINPTMKLEAPYFCSVTESRDLEDLLFEIVRS